MLVELGMRETTSDYEICMKAICSQNLLKRPRAMPCHFNYMHTEYFLKPTVVLMCLARGESRPSGRSRMRQSGWRPLGILPFRGQIRFGDLPNPNHGELRVNRLPAISMP